MPYMYSPSQDGVSSQPSHTHTEDYQNGKHWRVHYKVRVKFSSPDYSRMSSNYPPSPPQSPRGSSSVSSTTSLFSQLKVDAEHQVPEINVQEDSSLEAFKDEGHQLCSHLGYLLKLRESLSNNKGPIRELLATLDFWKQEVANAAVALVSGITNTHGHGEDNSEYLWTSDFAIYFWWRTCKIAWDIESSILPVDNDTMNARKTLDSESILEVFESLLDAFYKVFQGDVAMLKSGGHPTMKGDPDFRIMSLVELLETGVVFQTSPNLQTFPDIVYLQLGRERPSNSSIDNGHEVLRLLLANCPILFADFERLVLEYKPRDRQKEQISPWIVRNGKYPSSHLGVDIHKNSLFQEYLNRVVAKSNKSTAREVRHIYHNLARGTEAIFVLFNRLRLLLSGAPELFTEFKKFVPSAAMTKWIAAEDITRTEAQVSGFKRRLRLEWIALIETAKQHCEDSISRDEISKLQKIEMRLKLLPTACTLADFSWKEYTPGAESEIIKIVAELHKFQDVILAGLKIFDALTDETKGAWQTVIVTETEKIVEMLRRRATTEVEKAGVGVGYLDLFLNKVSDGSLV